MIIEIAEAIYQNNNRHYVVIVANKDKIIENLDEDVMVEVLCKLGKMVLNHIVLVKLELTIKA